MAESEEIDCLKSFITRAKQQVFKNLQTDSDFHSSSDNGAGTMILERNIFSYIWKVLIFDEN